MSTIFSVLASYVGYKSYKLLKKDSENEENKLMGRLAGLLGFGASSLLCHKFIVHIPKSVEELRQYIKKDTAFKKLTFSEDFDDETEKALDRISPVCQITLAFPRFPVRDARVRNNGEKRGQIYDWACLRYVLSQPPEKRICKALISASYNDFEFCEDTCRAIHQILFARGKIFSENPIEALKSDLNIIENIEITVGD